jgi:hypothetical protein
MALLDQSVLAGNVTFVSRVSAGLVGACISIQSEAITTNTQLLHARRAALAMNILQTMVGNPTAWPAAMSLAVATNPTVISDATIGGTLVLNTANVVTAQALVTDTDLNNAISSAFNSYANVTTA